MPDSGGAIVADHPHTSSIPGAQPLRRPRHERFCQEIAKGASAPEAYRLAGYNLAPSNDCSNAARLSRNEQVKLRTAYLMHRSAQKAEITSDRILQELALIGFARMSDYIHLLEKGDLSSITSEQSAAITELSVHTDKHGHKRARIKLAAKREALVDLGKAIGLFDDRPDITVPVTFLVQRSGRTERSVTDDRDAARDATGDG